MMQLGKWLFMLAIIGWLLCGPARTQTIKANKLCIHSGSEYYVNGPFYNFPNHGSMRYFPSFAHWTSTPRIAPTGKVFYPWKIAGWGWEGIQAANYGPIWTWESCLQYSVDLPYSTAMSFDYPALFCMGIVPHTGTPFPIFNGIIPNMVPDVGGNRWIYPDSAGGFSPSFNIFATGAATWMIPSTLPYYGWEFSFSWDCASALTVPSVQSIVEYVWMTKGTYPQYCLLDGNTPDCLGGPGNKMRNYSLIGDADNFNFWYWPNSCNGVQFEWSQCLFVCDAITIPVNVPGATNAANPFAAYGFDVGVATLNPYLSSNCVSLQFMTEDYTGLGGNRIILGAMAAWPCIGPYGAFLYRVPHGWDVLTNLFLSIPALFMHNPAGPYPACMFGTTIGAHTARYPFPADPKLLCAEIRWSSYATAPGQPMSASYMVTHF